MRNRRIQRELKKWEQIEEKKKEQSLSIKNWWGLKDLTPYNAVQDIRGEDIVYKGFQG